jgi:hypothetical protein
MWGRGLESGSHWFISKSERNWQLFGFLRSYLKYICSTFRHKTNTYGFTVDPNRVNFYYILSLSLSIRPKNMKHSGSLFVIILPYFLIPAPCSLWIPRSFSICRPFVPRVGRCQWNHIPGSSRSQRGNHHVSIVSYPSCFSEYTVVHPSKNLETLHDDCLDWDT